MKHNILQMIKNLIPLMTTFEYEEYLAGRFDVVETDRTATIVFHRQMAT